MSELLNTNSGRNDFRWQLLTTVSALALMGSVYGAQDAKADGDTDRPTLWIELGGQLEQQTGQDDAYAPAFVADNPDSPAFKPVSPLSFQKPPLFSNGAQAKLTFEPSGTDWVFSASVLFGRSNGHGRFNQSHRITHVTQVTEYAARLISVTPSGLKHYSHYAKMRTITQYGMQTAQGQISQSQSHAIVDFTVGKDVGLGMFGSGSVSNFNVGVRFAQFASRASGFFNARPDPKFPVGYNLFDQQHHPSHLWRREGYAEHFYHATFQNQRDFHGIGPSVSWNASLPVLGEPQAETLNVDWGANASVLFGRQRANSSHQTSVYYHVATAPPSQTQHTSVGGLNRSHAVVIPNIGGFAGMSFHFPNAKVSLGYRGDFFFGAMDSGNDVRTTKAVGFYGPFATISVGIGG